jgi:cellulose synthase operon protein C
VTSHGRAGEYLDGALDAADEAVFLAHLTSCVECQEALHAEVQIRNLEELARDPSSAVAPASRAQAPHGLPGEYLDGCLDRAAEEAFIDHLAVCAACQGELHDEVQLRDREEALREAAVPAPQAVAGSTRARPPGQDMTSAAAPPVRPRRRRSLRWTSGSLVAAGVAATLAWWLRSPPGPASDPGGGLALVLKPSRLIEIRLSHPATAKYRPYDTMLGSTTPNEPISPAVIAELDAAHDCHGVAAAYVLAGAWGLADERYRSCPPGLDIDADRAGLGVLRGRFEDALELTEHVLDAAPDHTVALWNRALALRALGLGLTAAAAFERVAVLERASDPGWAQEASTDAAVARAQLDRMRTDYLDLDRLGKEMARGGPPLDLALAGRVPARARIWLHNALRTATTPARVDELAPLAAAIEGLQGEGLARYVAQARAQLSPERTAAAEAYRQFVVEAAGRIDDRAWARWLAAAARARLDDLILGARLVTHRLDGTPSADQLAAATRDPWFERAVELAHAQAALNAGRVEDGAARLAAIQAHCPPDATSYRCLQLAVALAELGIQRDQPSETMRHALNALSLSLRLGEWPQRGQALTLAGDAQRLGGNLASARGYFEEAVHARVAAGEPCAARVLTFTMAEMLHQRHRLARARTFAAEAPACDEVPRPVELVTLARMLRSGYPIVDRATVLAEIARARAAPGIAGDRVLLDFLVEWLALDDDLAARDRLAALAGAAKQLEGSERVKLELYVDGALLADAARRGAWSDALGVVARARGVPPPSRCALAFGADDFRFAVMAVGPDGAVTGRYEPDRARADEWLAPEPMRRTLAGCDEVAVLALPPWLGIGPVLDPSTAWRYVLGPPGPLAAGRARYVAVTDPVPPPSAELAPLVPRPWPPPPAGPDELIAGLGATPERVLAAIADATLVEIRSHAITLDPLDAPVIALSPGAASWTLDAAHISTSTLKGAPVVVLADCSGGAAARFEHQSWGLPLAFRTAGATAVIASLSAIPDRDAAAVFDAVITELKRGVSPASAVAHVRAEKLQRVPTSWVRNVVVFQ